MLRRNAYEQPIQDRKGVWQPGRMNALSHCVQQDSVERAQGKM